MADLEAQKAIVARLQLKWLERMETLIDEDKLSSTDAATLYRFMADNGWSLDPAKVSPKLRDKITDSVGFEDGELGLQVVR